MANTVRILLSVDGGKTVHSALMQVGDDAQKVGGHVGKLGSIMQGVFQGVGQAAFRAVETGIGKVVGVLEDSQRAFEEMQVSQGQMKVALQNNVVGFDGNTAAIERLMEARMRLGYDDEAQRSSFAILVGATKDVTKAEQAQMAAMDLARLKGIDLAEATSVITNAMGGRTAGLKKLGIETVKGATQEQILAAITKVAGGQAEAYAATSAGKLAAAHVKVREAEEKLGAITNKVVESVLPGLVDAFDNIVTAAGPVLDEVGKQMPGILAKVSQAFDWLSKNVLPVLADAFDWIGKNVIPALGVALQWIQQNILPPLAAVAQWFSKEVLPALSKAFDWIGKNVLPKLSAAFDWLNKNVLVPLGKTIDWIVVNVLPPISKALDWLAKNVLPPLGEAFNGLVTVVSAAMGVVMTVIQPVIDLIVALGGKLDDLIGKKKQATGGFMNSAAQNALWANASAGDMAKLPSTLQHFATGGVVRGPVGAPQLVVAHGGETVTPAGKSHGDIYFTVNNPVPEPVSASIRGLRLAMMGYVG